MVTKFKRLKDHPNKAEAGEVGIMGGGGKKRRQGSCVGAGGREKMIR
jgi:hypothetical protein